MAEPSDVLADVAQVAESVDLTGPVGPVHRNLDDARRKKEQVRRIEAVSLKLAGLSYEQIGERLGISGSGAKDLVMRTLATAENRAVEAERELENARLDRAQAAIWAKVLEGDLKAVDVYLRISARRARMNGLDAPTKIDLAVSVRQEMHEALANLERIVLGEVISRVDDALPGSADA